MGFASLYPSYTTPTPSDLILRSLRSKRLEG
jgi:hypothetical protein